MAKRTNVLINCPTCGQNKPHDAQGLCHTCYTRLRRHGMPVVTCWTVPIVPPAEPPSFGSLRLPERFWAKVTPNSDGCWLWTGTLRNGYGRFNVGGRLADAHHLAYRVLVGPVPDGLELDHLCHSSDVTCMDPRCNHRACCNPEHLEPVTHKVNMERSGHSRKTHCPQKHPYSGWNLILRDGHRHCRACIYARTRAARAAARSARRAQGVR